MRQRVALYPPMAPKEKNGTTPQIQKPVLSENGKQAKIWMRRVKEKQAPEFTPKQQETLKIISQNAEAKALLEEMVEMFLEQVQIKHRDPKILLKEIDEIIIDVINANRTGLGHHQNIAVTEQIVTKFFEIRKLADCETDRIAKLFKKCVKKELHAQQEDHIR